MKCHLNRSRLTLLLCFRILDFWIAYRLVALGVLPLRGSNKSLYMTTSKNLPLKTIFSQFYAQYKRLIWTSTIPNFQILKGSILICSPKFLNKLKMYRRDSQEIVVWVISREARIILALFRKDLLLFWLWFVLQAIWPKFKLHLVWIRVRLSNCISLLSAYSWP